jgi:hypothetical protein
LCTFSTSSSPLSKDELKGKKAEQARIWSAKNREIFSSFSPKGSFSPLGDKYLARKGVGRKKLSEKKTKAHKTKREFWFS